MDKVYIKALCLKSLIGVYGFERHEKQRVIVDLTLYTDHRVAGKSDNVVDTLDYGKIAERLSEVAEQSEFKLLEALGSKMIEVIFTEFAVEKLELDLSKPDILANTDTVGISFVRERKEYL